MRFDRPTDTSFEEPGLLEPELKAAVRRAWGSHAAPAELRQRVMSALAGEELLASDSPTAATAPSADAPATVSPAFWRRRVFRWAAAAAAALVLGVGLAALERHTRMTPAMAAAHSPALGGTFPTQLAGALVRTHDGCLRFHPTDHHLFNGAPKDDFPKIAQAMSARLNHPVIAVSLGDGWAFHGAAICPVGDLKSAHLIYAHDDAAISVFSLPASVALSSCPDHQNCEAAVNGHPMAGFVENGGFFCIVATPGGKSTVDAQQVKTLRDQLHGQVVAAAESHHAPESLVATMGH